MYREVQVMIKKLLKKAIGQYTKTESELSEKHMEHDELRKTIIQNHNKTSAQIDQMRKKWGFTQYK